MKIDLTPLTRKLNAASGAVRLECTGPAAIELDEDAFGGRLAEYTARRMARNLFEGRRPDGTGSMPGRKKDGQPRGLGAKVALALHAAQGGEGQWLIAAHREDPGHLARILGEVPLRSPPMEQMKAEVDQAFSRSITVRR